MNTVPSLTKFLVLNLPFIFFVAAARAEWRPPDNPPLDPIPIVEGARRDAKAGLYQDALAKRAWFYQYAINSNKGSWIIVRFDRKAWQDLAKVYPPTLDKLREMRNDCEKAVQAGKRVFDFFNDFASFNRLLGEEKLTTKLFIWLDANNANGAKQAFRFAERQLENDQEYKLAVKYVDPETDFESFAGKYRLDSKLAKSEPSADSREKLTGYAEENFSHEATTLVALLVKAGRPGEAESIAVKARKEWDSPDFHAQLKKALEGIFPAP